MSQETVPDASNTVRLDPPDDLMVSAPEVNPEAGQELCRPAAEFYWSILNAADLPLGKPGSRMGSAAALALDEKLEHELPLPIESVHAIYRRIDDQRVLAIAATTDLVESVPGHVHTLHPATVPEFVARVCRVEPRSLNILTGRYEPAVIRRQRAGRDLLVTMGLVMLCGMVSWGFTRREREHEMSAQSARAACELLVRKLEPDTGISLTKTMDLMRQELADFRQWKASGMNEPESPDASETLEELLHGWPTDGPTARVDQVTISPSSVSLMLGVEGDAQLFLSRMRAPGGWSMEPPQLNVTRSGAQLSLQLRRTESVKGMNR